MWFRPTFWQIVCIWFRGLRLAKYDETEAEAKRLRRENRELRDRLGLN